MTMSEPVTHDECENHRRCMENKLKEAIAIEKNDREKDFDDMRGWLVRIEQRIDGLSSKLSAVIIELLIGMILALVAIVGTHL